VAPIVFYQLRFEVDQPPDWVVEFEITSSVITKMLLLAAMKGRDV